MLILEICLKLMRSLGVPVHLALEAAKRLTASSESTPQLPIAAHLMLTVDIPAIMRDVNARLADAVEVAPSPKRGRPPRPL